MADDIKQIAFPPEVLATIAPDLSLQRHLKLGLRPCLRNLDEFKPLEVSTGKLQETQGEKVYGSSVVVHGQTKAICGITLGFKELVDGAKDSGDNSYASVYPVVEISRGRSGAPTDEEMITSQKLYENILHSKLIRSSELQTKPGLVVQDDETKIVYPGEDDDGDLFSLTKTYRWVLYAHIMVFSRSGPLFDVCYAALINALKDTSLPRLYIQDSLSNIKIPVRSRGKFGHLIKANDILIDPNPGWRKKLALGNKPLAYSSSFGIIDTEENFINGMEVDSRTLVLADLEGDAEESECVSTVNVITDGTASNIHNVSVVGGGSQVSKELLKKCIKAASARARSY